MNKANPFIRYRYHFAAWLLLAIVWYYLRYQDYSSSQKAMIVTLVKVTDLAILIYLTNYVLVPSLLYRKKYVLFLLCFLTMVLISSYAKMQLIGFIMGNPNMFNLSGANLKTRIYDNVLPHIFLVIAGAAIKLIYDHTRMQQRLTEIAKEKAETELQFLKSQINPHFLFNSLNAVFFLIDKENKEARDALHKFSEMLRYQLYEMNGARIPIEKEIRYLQDYVDLQKLRKEDNYLIRFDCAADIQGFSIAPLLLIPFVENAFKHISSFAEKNNFVTIALSRQNGQFDFSVHNSREEEKSTARPGGIGLANVRRRLELLYPGKHAITVENKAGCYKVNLSLTIDQL